MTTHGCTRRRLTGLDAWRIGPCGIGVLLPMCAICQPSPDPASNEEALSEIVVTARKFEERVQDIPMSVQVLSAEFLDKADTTRLFDLQFNVPGLVVSNLGLFGAGFSLRGLGDQGGNEQTVASHLNGVYLGNANLAIARLFDLERIEVLKGPQGTLYGRNSTGGSMNFITRSAHDEFSADIETAYGSFSTVRAQGHVNLPFEKAALRLAFIGSEGDGYIRNSVDDRQFGENDFWGLRGSLRFNLSDRLSLDLTAQTVSDDGASDELWSPQPQFLVNPRDIRLTTVTLVDPYLLTDTDVVSANLDYEFGFGHFRSITGYAGSNVSDRDDCAGSPDLQGCVRGTTSTRHEQWSQEFQLASGDEAHIAWLLGANYFSVDTATDWYLLVPLANPIPLRDLFGTTEETAIAVFGQAIVPISDRWSLTGGLRFSNDEQSATSIGSGVQDSPTLKTAEDDWNNVSWRIDLEFRPTDEMLLYASVAT
ncbi:MAG: TonB-dependent receptor, partial [Gammaproteobacteria bacterium]|nr:TonB-dependent receptor [Gammaproteobacteria bacterium]